MILKTLKRFKQWVVAGFSEQVITFTIIALLVLGIIQTVFSCKMKAMEEQVVRANNNMQAYRLIAEGHETNSRTLELTIKELQISKDSIVQQMRLQLAQLKIDQDMLLVAVHNTQILNDSLFKYIPDKIQTIEPCDPIPPDLCDFNEEYKMGPQTSVNVERKGGYTMVKIDLRNDQTLFLYNQKQYIYPNRGFGWRLTHLFKGGFKKTQVTHHTLTNSNAQIQNSDLRIIKVHNKL